MFRPPSKISKFCLPLLVVVTIGQWAASMGHAQVSSLLVGKVSPAISSPTFAPVLLAKFGPLPLPLQEAEASSQANRQGVLVKIPLPVDSAAAAKIRLTLQQVVEKAPQVIRAADRQVVVLEFDTTGGKTGSGSELEACQSVARYLSSAELNRLETIAYIPVDSRSGEQATGRLNGHAVLIAIAANQIAMDQGASLGNAGVDEESVDGLISDVYRGIASQRLNIPIPMVLAMLDKNRQLFRVRTDKGSVFVNDQELKQLEEKGEAIETTTLTRKGESTQLTAQQLDDFRLLRFKVQSRAELARELDLDPYALDRSPGIEGEWRAVQVELPPLLDPRSTQWIIRSLTAKLSSTNPPNLILFNIESVDGDIDASLSLARYIVDLNHDRVQSVAVVSDSAMGPLGVVALSCDHLIMQTDATLGGHLVDAPEQELSPDALADLTPMIKALARDRGNDWSLMLAMIDPRLEVTRFRHKQTGQIRLLADQELKTLAQPDDWLRLERLDVAEGVTANLAEQNYIARTVVGNFEEVKTFYQLDEDPPKLTPTATDRWVEQIAIFLSSPIVSFWLLFGGMFFLSSEMSAPGLGVPGFMSAMCFLLFFWSHHLDGNAHWLEIMMFVAGGIFIAIEIFALPGFGVFGIGGLVMMMLSLVMASQNFLIPRNSEELAQLPASMLPLVGAGFGFFVAIFALRKILPNSPYFNRMMLKPRQRSEETGLESDRDPEAIVDWSFLEGDSGETITRLFPSGKARISGTVYDVITDGRMVDKGVKVKVIEAIGNRVVVKPIEPE